MCIFTIEKKLPGRKRIYEWKELLVKVDLIF